MLLKRYTTQELIPIFTEIFYDYMSEDNSSEFPTQVDILYNEYNEKIDHYKKRIMIYQTALADGANKDCAQSLLTQLNYLKQGLRLLQSSDMANQKEVYARTKTVDFCRTSIKIPLDKKINSYYDDLTLLVNFYDDVCTPNGKYEEFLKLKTQSERRDFIKENTEITHMGLLYYKEGRLIAVIGVLGNLNSSEPRVTSSGVVLLPHKFSDFENLTLADTSEITENNDLKQYIQTKIDLDKEDMEELSSMVIRGDRYSIHKPNKDAKEDLYIRYTCRSTGRVYYNKLNLRNLSISSEFKENDYDSYCRAWWNLNTLGGKVDGKPVIRC